MIFDKVKTLRAAEKYLEMGKIPAAIKEYCRIVETEPDDFNTLNMLGDLYTRVGNPTAAISCFHRIAEHYRGQGFGLKAIAVYRKIDRLQPNSVEIATHLGELYASQGLVVEARAHYLTVSEAHARAGSPQAALEVLNKIADLDPQNTEIRNKLAHGYLKEGMTAEAADAFSQVGQQLLARGSLDNALDAFGKALEISPADHASLQGLLAAHCARATADEAAEVIERAVAANPDDVDLVSMLANAYVEAEDPAQAERVTELLVSKEPSSYLRYLDVARLYLASDKLADAVRVVAAIAEQMLAEREEIQLLEVVNDLLANDADNVQALRLLVRTHWWQRDMEKLRAALERMAEAAEAAGLEQDERYALTQLTRLAPDQAHLAARLNQLGGAELGSEAEPLPEFEAVDEPLAESEQEAAPTSEPEFAYDQTTLSPRVGEAEFEWNSVAAAGEDWTDTASETSIERGFTFEAVVAQELATDAGEVVTSDPIGESRNATVRAQELESVDFYIAQGYADIALDTLDLLERQFGTHEDIDVRRRQLATIGNSENAVTTNDEQIVTAGPVMPPEPEPASAPVVTPTVAAPPVAVPVAVAPPAPEPVSTPVNQGIHPSLAEVFEEYRVSAESDTPSETNGDYETHYNLGLAYKEMDLFEEALEEFQTAAGLVAPGDGTPRYLQCCNLLGHCFMQKGVPQLAMKWFDTGLNAPGASADERLALRFELGAAYEQIGDLKRAIEIFTEVYGTNVSYRGVNERLRALQVRAGTQNGNGAQKHKPAKPSKPKKHRSNKHLEA